MNPRPLKTALLANAAFSSLSGLALVGFSPSIVDVIGTGTPTLYQIIGLGLLGFAGLVAWTATRQPINPFVAALISGADFLWVLGTFLLIVLASSALQPAGIVTLIVVAGIVLFFGLRQLQGINRMYAVPGTPNTHKLCVAVETPEAADTLWPLIADLASIQTYSPNLTQVILRDDAQPGVDAVRQCTDVNGKTWGEHCQLYDPQARKVEFAFLADEPGFPYPFKTMVGGWEVVPNGNGSIVNIWFEVTPKYGLAHPIILAVMAKDLARSFAEVVARMAAAGRGETVPVAVKLADRGITGQLAACS
ncbi:MAG: SRPBCC family protein [Chloroflexi bacterium]|nr:SRPBCC family protein [Chloroflexota bacterium]